MLLSLPKGFWLREAEGEEERLKTSSHRQKQGAEDSRALRGLAGGQALPERPVTGRPCVWFIRMGLNLSEPSLCFPRACPLQPKHPCHKLSWNNAQALPPPSEAIFSLYIQPAFVGIGYMKYCQC